MGEFDFIEKYFRWPVRGQWKSSGIGDDCAVVSLGARDLVLTKDIRSITTHFLRNVHPYTCGYKALAVNLSDLAAAGARPRGFLLGLSTPEHKASWFEPFVLGMKRLARKYRCDLLGGDTTGSPWVQKTRAPLTISITALGVVPAGKALRRCGAQVGDDIWVSGSLGDAYAALQGRLQHWDIPLDLLKILAKRMDQPRPRVDLGIAIRPYAHACADISDGLWQDLGHILRRSQVGACVNIQDVPRSRALEHLPQVWQRRAIGGGDDYELVWTASSKDREILEEKARHLGIRITRIGTIMRKTFGRKIQNAQGQLRDYPKQGFDHFQKEES